MKTDTHCFNDDGQYKDYEIFIDGIAGYDWKFHGYWDYENKRWSALQTFRSLPGDSYDECKPEDVPHIVMVAANMEYDKIKAKGIKP